MKISTDHVLDGHFFSFDCEIWEWHWEEIELAAGGLHFSDDQRYEIIRATRSFVSNMLIFKNDTVNIADVQYQMKYIIDLTDKLIEVLQYVPKPRSNGVNPTQEQIAAMKAAVNSLFDPMYDVFSLQPKLEINPVDLLLTLRGVQDRGNQLMAQWDKEKKPGRPDEGAIFGPYIEVTARIFNEANEVAGNFDIKAASNWNGKDKNKAGYQGPYLRFLLAIAEVMPQEVLPFCPSTWGNQAKGAIRQSK